MIRAVTLSCVLLVSAVARAWAQSPTPAGTFSAPVTAPLPATFRKDPAEIVIYVGVADITATLAKVQAAGGSVVFPRFVVPGRVVLGMFTDPAGNKVGLVEMDNGKPKVP